MEYSEIFEKVKAIIVDKLGVEPSVVTESASFTNDIGADSLDTVELLMEFEKVFGIKIPDEETSAIVTVKDACDKVAEKLAKQMGKTLEVHKVEWDSIGMSLDAGDYDVIIAGMGRTKEREASYSFTDPYYYRDNCLVVKKGSGLENIKGLSELAGKNVTLTTQLGTGWVNLLDQVPDAKLGANYETTAECFMAISNGTADVCVIDVPTAESAAMTNDDLAIIYLDPNDKFQGDEEMTNVCIATRKDDTELRDKVQEAMNAIGWNDKAKMDELMNTVLTQQPAAN